MTQIKIGDTLPEISFTTMTDEGPSPRSVQDAFGGKSVALFAVPGAFTPTCHNSHLPGFLQQAEALAAKGVDEIACVSVNDVFVLSAWAKATGAEGDITMLADGSGDFTKAIGMELDLTARGLGLRSKRYAMLVDNKVVKALLVEDIPGQAQSSSAESLLAAL